MSDRFSAVRATRRAFLAGAGAILVMRPAQATPASLAAAIHQIAGEAAIKPGKIKLSIPPLVENGNAVAITVSVDSPMTAAEHVRSIHVFTEKNPQPYILTARLGPRAGRATVTTRARIADSGRVIAIAQLSDGSFWQDTVPVVVTLSACLEDGLI